MFVRIGSKIINLYSIVWINISPDGSSYAHMFGGDTLVFDAEEATELFAMLDHPDIDGESVEVEDEYED